MKLLDIIKSTSQFRERQYKVKRVRIVDVKYVPNSQQLYIYGEALPLTGDKLYREIIVFDKVKSSPVPDKNHLLKFKPDDHMPTIYLTKPDENSNVRVRCSCPDSYFSYEYYNKLNKGLVGPHKKYVRKTDWWPERNPQHLPGLCKHTLAIIRQLIKLKLIKTTPFIVGYLNRKPMDVNK